MVDVSAKEVTDRLARAEGAVRMSSAAFELVRTNAVAKGDVLAVGRLAGIQAAKRTAELIPLCHPLPLDQIEVELSLDPSLPGVRIAAQARTAAKTARCRVEPARKLVIDAKGNEVAASARAFLDPDVEVTAESLFTADGVRYTVLDVKRQINAKGEAHHLEVMLTSGR